MELEQCIDEIRKVRVPVLLPQPQCSNRVLKNAVSAAGLIVHTCSLVD